MTDFTNAVVALKPELWTVSLNSAMSIYITDTQGSASSFGPAFTYPIFGAAETIFGYQDLQILLCFDAVTFLPFLNVKWSAAMPNVDVDVKEKMLAQLPESTVFKDEALWRDCILEEQQNYEIPGTQMGPSWQSRGETWAVYKLDFASERGLELHKRMQILVLLFIEAGTYIDAHDPLWDVYVLYNTSDPALPVVAGFTTVYNYWKYPGHVRFDADVVETRKKISQFVILPNYQGQHLGGQLYGHLFEQWLKDDKVVEVVVEDPKESFDDLRDRVDLTRLVGNGHIDLQSISISTVTAPGWFEKFQKEQKLEERQLQRLLEMVFLRQRRDGLGKETAKSVRLFVKRRLYEKNSDALADMDEPTRLDKLQTAYIGLEEDYERVLKPVEFKKRRESDAPPAPKKQKK
ncbi:acyl-CoA N-acyltransferase [Metschnikowia bicuspidata]|uniref:Histone acetyltransferase type B catalytic subunit n=1 Tax=Metschnikowia bicuspidata TaxID=27322 RepID=A0A4P9ZCB4_9ASCO|nr:acyl-CoA N-acyltransferase [Metschnikowia bicuspidata]